VALGVNLNHFRQTVAEYNSLYAQSAIQDYIQVGSPLGGAANGLLCLLLLLVPVPMVLAGQPIYLAFAGMISVLWVATAVVIVRGMRAGWFRADVRLARATSLLVSLVTVQSVFEPDYGSYIKHLTPLLPLFLVVLRARRAGQLVSTDDASGPGDRAGSQEQPAPVG
jgi:hypothetical protein